MLDTKEEIKKNPIVNRFNEIAETYGIRGMYVEWCPGGLNEGGIYYVCGLDSSKINQTNINMKEILDNMRNGEGDICTDVSAFKIDGEHPLIAHRYVVNYCQQLNTLQNVYGHFNEPIPSRMDPNVIEIMDVAWRHFANPEKFLGSKLAHEETLSKAIEIVKQNLDPSSPEYKKYQYLVNGYYDSGRSKMYNWAKMHFAKHKNEVSLSHLVNHAGSINYATITYASYPFVKAALEQKPNILYHFSEVRGDVLEVNGNEGYGSKEKNDRRYYTLHYPTIYTKEIEKILLELDYPEEFNRTLMDIDPNRYGVEYVVVPDEYFETFRELCSENNVKICIDKSSHDTVCGGVPIAFSAQHSEKAYSMLNASIKAFENDISPKLLSKEPRWNEIEEPQLKTINSFVEPEQKR